MAARARPLSPHLQIYRPQLTSVLSIVHRMTGVALTVAALLLTWALVALATGPDSWAIFQDFMRSLLGRLLTAAFVVSMVYHFLNGLRHLGWDMGWGLDLDRTYTTGWIVVLLTIALSALVLWRAWA